MAYYGLVTLLHPYDSFQWVKKTPAYYTTNEG